MCNTAIIKREDIQTLTRWQLEQFAAMCEYAVCEEDEDDWLISIIYQRFSDKIEPKQHR